MLCFTGHAVVATARSHDEVLALRGRRLRRRPQPGRARGPGRPRRLVRRARRRARGHRRPGAGGTPLPVADGYDDHHRVGLRPQDPRRRRGPRPTSGASSPSGRGLGGRTELGFELAGGPAGPAGGPVAAARRPRRACPPASWCSLVLARQRPQPPLAARRRVPPHRQRVPDPTCPDVRLAHPSRPRPSCAISRVGRIGPLGQRGGSRTNGPGHRAGSGTIVSSMVSASHTRVTTHPWADDVPSVSAALETDPTSGLRAEQAARRLDEVGPNAARRTGPARPVAHLRPPVRQHHDRRARAGRRRHPGHRRRHGHGRDRRDRGAQRGGRVRAGVPGRAGDGGPRGADDRHGTGRP